MKQIRKRLTYANVMSSIAVFLMLGGATAFAATKIGANEIKANSIKTGKIVKEAVTEGKIKNGAVTTNKIANLAVTEGKLADNSVTTTKIADKAVTGAKINAATLGPVPNATNATNATNAANAEKLGGQPPSSFVARSTLLWAVVNGTGSLADGSGAISAVKTGTGRYDVTFDRSLATCGTEGSSTDVTGGAAPEGNGSRIISTDNRIQEDAQANVVNVTTTNPAGALADPETGDGFTITVFC